LFVRRRIDPCLVCLQDTACASSAHKTQHGLLSCPLLSLVFLVQSPTRAIIDIVLLSLLVDENNLPQSLNELLASYHGLDDVGENLPVIVN
jgi:hypothetical protein